MRDTWRLALAQTAGRLGGIGENLDEHLRLHRAAAEDGADLVLFPELSLTGYDLRDLVPEVAQSIGDSEVLDRLAAATSSGPAICAGFVEESEDHQFYNAAGYFEDGRLVQVHRKVHLPSYGMFDEARFFSAGRAFRAFDTGLGRFGMLICEDFWHLPPPWLLALDGSALLLILSASPVKTSRPPTAEGEASRGHATQSIWTDLARMSARMYTMYAAFSNRAGSEDQTTYGGGSFLVDPTGAVVASAEPLEESLVLAEVRDAEVRRARIRWPLLRGERPEVVLREMERLLRSDQDDDS